MFTINQNLIDDFADKINEKEKKNNKVTSWSSTTTDTHYPSEKLVKDSLDDKADNEDIPTNLSDLNNDEGFVTQNHTHSIEDTDLFSVLDCVNDNFDDLSDGNYIIILGSD